MTINYGTQKVTVPTAFVTKGRQRVKQFNQTVYLKNGDEFEIELFNPTQSKILAQINVNGKSPGRGIVLRPGERVFLERYFDEAKKFLFDTYKVDGSDSNVKKAIQNNGLIEVEFYNEATLSISCGTTTTTVYNPTWIYHTGTSNGTFNGYNHSFTTSGNVNYSSLNENNTLNLCSSDVSFDTNVDPAAIPMETGRVEKGSDSSQEFLTDLTTFNTYFSWKTTWKILPESQKPILKEDLAIYCSECGAKRKKTNHKFCPSCGTKF